MELNGGWFGQGRAWDLYEVPAKDEDQGEKRVVIRLLLIEDQKTSIYVYLLMRSRQEKHSTFVSFSITLRHMAA